MLRHTQDSLNSLNANGRSSYSHQSTCIKLIVKDTSDGFPDSDQVGCHPIEEKDLNRTVILNHDLLMPPTRGRPSSLSSCSSNETCPTPTPSYRDLLLSTSIEYPGAEEEAFNVRGVEVAMLEEDPEVGTGK